MSRLSKFLRGGRAGHGGPKVQRIVVTGEPPSRMATFADDHVIGKAIRETGRFQESAILDVVRFLEREAPLRPLFVDIGANIGTHSIFALNNGFDRAVCIEPDPANFMLLRINQILNGLDGRCTNINAAASEEAGELAFELSADNFGDHRIRMSGSRPAGGGKESSRKLIAVKAAPLDLLLKDNAVDPRDAGLVWIDTQGHEGHVLSRAKTLEAAKAPIVLEFWPYGLARSAGYALLRSFLARQAQIFDIRAPGTRPEPLGIEAIDRMYEDWRGAATAERSPHTDLVVLNR